MAWQRAALKRANFWNYAFVETHKPSILPPKFSELRLDSLYVGVTDHNLLLTGPPGSGKSMLAQRMPGILPEMSLDESFEVTRIASVAGLLGERSPLITTRPFSTPHDHVSLAGLMGGGAGLARPDDISLAHEGVGPTSGSLRSP